MDEDIKSDPEGLAWLLLFPEVLLQEKLTLVFLTFRIIERRLSSDGR